MIYVIFEVIIKKDCMEQYLVLATKLKEHLSNQKGFIRSERFSSIVNDRKLLSLSVWENEEAVDLWRNQIEHRLSQQSGRDSIFESYMISVTSKIRCYSDINRKEAPIDSNQYFNQK